MNGVADRRDGTGGFVLIAVLSVMALLAGLMLAVSLFARNSVDSALLDSADLEADALIQAGENLAGYELFVAKLPPDRIDGQQVRLDGGTLSLSVTSEAGKVDLNGADKDLLAAAFAASGARSMPAASFAARVIDWRDANGERIEGGAESAEYRAAGLAYGAGNIPFRSVGELRWLLGLSASDIVTIGPFVTVFNPLGRLDIFSASPRLVAALPGMTDATARTVMTLRGSRDPKTISKLVEATSDQANYLDFATPHSWRVRIEAMANRSGRAKVAEIVVIASTTKDEAFQVVDWQQ